MQSYFYRRKIFKDKNFNLMVEREVAITTIKKFVNACGEKNIFFNKVILFGSFANGTQREYSDIDVALVSDQFSGMPLSDWHMLAPVGIKFSDIEPHPYSTKYFEEGDPLIEVIKKTGIEIN